MRAYVFQADLYCEACGDKMRAELPPPAGYDPDNESSYDSGDWPKGPFPDGGGEADSPCHCGGCGVFLENPLTDDGRAYVAQAWPRGTVSAMWRRFYGIRAERST